MVVSFSPTDSASSVNRLPTRMPWSTMLGPPPSYSQPHRLRSPRCLPVRRGKHAPLLSQRPTTQNGVRVAHSQRSYPTRRSIAWKTKHVTATGFCMKCDQQCTTEFISKNFGNFVAILLGKMSIVRPLACPSKKTPFQTASKMNQLPSIKSLNCII